MLTFQIDEKHRITSDDDSWQVRKFMGIEKKTGEEIWKPQTYYTSLSNAVNALAARMLRVSDAVGPAETLKENKRILAKFAAALDPEYRIEPKEQ